MEATLFEKFSLFLILIGSLTVHEFAHAWVADKLGDTTPRSMGRVSLSPMAHLDWMGTVIIPLVMILAAPGFAILGWGKPVLINPRNFKNPKRDEVLATLAGPMSNLVLALIAAVAFGVWLGFCATPEIAEKVSGLGLNIVYLNVLLAVFNLLPIPPLDGSYLMRYLTGMSELTFIRIAQWGWIILLVAINLPIFRKLLQVLVMAAATPYSWLMETLANLVAKLH